MTPPDHGLTGGQLAEIRRILAPFAGRIDSVCLFGSRARGTHGASSDIDLVLHGPLAEADIDRLRTLFRDSSLPYKVDLHGYDHALNPALRSRFEQEGRILFRQDELALE